MSITISGQNNNDKIIASDGVLDSISGFNIVGVLTTGSLDVTNFDANHINVGSNIQLGNAGIITATTLIGNVTGNVNATSNLLLQVGGSEKFRIASSGQLGIGGANYGTSGQVLTSGGSGSAATWSTISIPAADKIIEGNTEAEVYDTGSNTSRFTVTTEGSERLRITSDGKIGIGTASPTFAAGGGVHLQGGNEFTSYKVSAHTNTGVDFAQDASGNAYVYNRDNADLLLGTNNTQRVRINNSGAIGLGGANYGSSGQVLTSQGSGSAVTWSTVSGTTINNNADNRVITGSGTANTLNGESKVNIDSSGRMIIGTVMTVGSNNHYDDITINNSNQSGNAGSTGITFISNNGQYAGLIFTDPDVDQAGYIKYYHNSNLDQLVFGVNDGARWEMISAGHWVPHADSSYDVGTNTKRVRNVYTDSFYATSLSYNGNQLKLGDGNGPTSSAGYYDDIKIDNSDNSSGEAGGTGIEFISGNQSWAGLIFSDSDSAQQGYVKYSHQNDYTTIAAAGQERLRLLANNIQAINCTGALTLPLGTTAQRPTAATGMIRYNSTESELEMYNGSEWLGIKTVPNTINLYYLVIGGGGAGGGSYRAGGGGAGAYRTNWNNEAQGGGQSVGSAFAVDVASTPTYSVIIGSGGSPSSGNNGGAGGTTTFATIVANGGTGGAKYEQPAPSNSGTGSGGGGGGHSGVLRAGASGGTYGYAGGAGSNSGSYQCGGGGGGAASAGIQGNHSASRSNAGDGGSALASTITGSSVLRAGGGGAGAYGGGNSTGGGVNGGPASGGGGAGRGAYGYRTGESATANTGSGGGGSPGSQNEIGGSGGSGLIILRYSNAATATYTSGVTYTRSTIGSDVVDTITLTSNSSQSVTFS